MSAKLLILKGDSQSSAVKMFNKHGIDTTTDYSDIGIVDGVVFMGGSDVSPYIYGEEPHGARGCDPVRDELEKEIYGRAQDRGIPCIGICRGGQLLNVLNGGTMIQHLGETISGVVSMWDRDEQCYFDVLVDHHQGIVARPDVIDDAHIDDVQHDDRPDYLVFYPKTKSFCFQPHPEWGHQDTEFYFFKKLVENQLI